MRYISYWAAPDQHKAFCLVEAPDAEVPRTVHKEAHGLVADEIHPVVLG